MRNLGLAAVIVAGLINYDRLYYDGALLAPVGRFLWRCIAPYLMA